MKEPDWPALPTTARSCPIMFKRRFIIPSTVSIAVLAACFMASSAHAGLLGGGGGAWAGGAGGALNESFTPRSLDVAGQAGGQLRRDGALPRGDQVQGAAGAAAHKTGETKSAAAEHATGMKGTASGT